MASNPSDNTSLVCVGPVKRGRPESYTDAIAEEICERIAAGERLTWICEDDHIPTIQTVSKWLLRKKDFNLAYGRAREAQQLLEGERLLDIADDPTILPEHKRIMVDTRKWTAERLNRRVYGNSVKHEHTVDAVGAAAGAEALPPGLNFLAKFLPESEKEG